MAVPTNSKIMTFYSQYPENVLHLLSEPSTITIKKEIVNSTRDNKRWKCISLPGTRLVSGRRNPEVESAASQDLQLILFVK